MRRISTVLLPCAWITLLTACGDGSDTPQQTPTYIPVEIAIASPSKEATEADTRTRVGDPGEDTQETYDDWNRLTLIVAYKQKATGSDIYDPQPGKRVYYDTFTREEFNSPTGTTHNGTSLSPADGNGYHTYTLNLPQGTVNIYGVTYSVNDGSATGNDHLDLDPEQQAGNDPDKVLDLRISNDYAGNDFKKMLSVATGYAVNTLPTARQSRDLAIASGKEMESKQYWRMQLRRLATKLDIQWDAKGAYEASRDSSKIVYNDVEVSDFSYDGGADSTSSGQGRLFPSLQEEGVAPVGGRKTFVNTSYISKRNGRQYHYLFPDGSATPRVVFSVGYKSADSEGTDRHYFDLSSVLPLRQAAWYKLNVTISGRSTATGIPLPATGTTGTGD